MVTVMICFILTWWIINEFEKSIWNKVRLSEWSLSILQAFFYWILVEFGKWVAFTFVEIAKSNFTGFLLVCSFGHFCFRKANVSNICFLLQVRTSLLRSAPSSLEFKVASLLSEWGEFYFWLFLQNYFKVRETWILVSVFLSEGDDVFVPLCFEWGRKLGKFKQAMPGRFLISFSTSTHISTKSCNLSCSFSLKFAARCKLYRSLFVITKRFSSYLHLLGGLPGRFALVFYDR